jgi:DNA modification methylase
MIRKLQAEALKSSSTVQIGDARKTNLSANSIDAIISSPPYLNAIDYMRGHKLSLVWLGHKIAHLRSIRSSSVGSESGEPATRIVPEALKFLDDSTWYSALDTRMQAIVRRYSNDAWDVSKEYSRVLRSGGTMTLVIGNSTVRGVYVPNDSIFESACLQNGFVLKCKSEREIPSNRRYLPVSGMGKGNALFQRMRKESIVTFVKSG